LYVTPRNASLNVRSGPSLSAPVLGIIQAGSAYEVIGQSGDWYIINFVGYQGYVLNAVVTTYTGTGVVIPVPNAVAVPAPPGPGIVYGAPNAAYATYTAGAYIAPVHSAPAYVAPTYYTPVAAPVAAQSVVTAPVGIAPYIVAQPPPPVIDTPLLNRTYPYVTPTVSVLNLRAGAGLNAGVIAQIPFGYSMQVLGQSGDWYLVNFAGLQGWIFAPYTNIVRDPSIPPSSPFSVVGYTVEQTGLYRRPWQTSLQIGLFPVGIGLGVVGRSADGRWVEILYDGQQGWVDASRLNFSGNPNALPIRP
jgi:uncharacterized protein YraI